MDTVVLNIAEVVDGVGLVIGLNHVMVGLGNFGAEVGDVAGAVGAALALGVDANSGGPVTEDLGLERVVDIEVLQVRSLGIVTKAGVLGGRALVVAGLLVALVVLLLVPGAGVLDDIEVSKRGHCVADNSGGGERGDHLVASF